MPSSYPDPAHLKCSTETSKGNARLVKRQSARWLSLAGLWLCLFALFLGVALLIERASAQVAPKMTISQTSSNEVQITVTNAAAGAQYELQRVSDLNALLDPGFIWPTEILGALGQTNFVVDMGIFYASYFRILGCVDCDSDGIPNFQDGQPNNSAVGTLAITIDSPTNGSSIQ